MIDKSQKLAVLNVASEMAPLAKQGGLGDVVGALPKILHQNGLDVRVLLPAYPGVLDRAADFGCSPAKTGKSVHVALDWRVYSAEIWKASVQGVTVYLLDQPELFTNPDIYPEKMNAQTVLPFVFLSYAALELGNAVGWQPDIFHSHDWPSAMVPTAMRWHKYYSRTNTSADSVITVHNLAHQAIVDPAMLEDWGLTKNAFSIEGLEFYGQANLLKGGVLASDAITTVSPHYSWDIQTLDGGFGLHGVFSENRHKLRGILNGIDYDIWNPKTDKKIPANFDVKNLSGKAKCKKKINELCGWPDDGRPILTFIGRLVEQKGIDILLTALDWSLVENCRMVLIGSGQTMYKDRVEAFHKSYPDLFWCRTTFDDEIAHLAYAGCDIMVMPSLFEPCGISQMIAMAYGTIPIVRATGGLADTVIDLDGSSDGTGFLFIDYSADELSHAIYRATEAYKDKDRWNQAIKNAMTADFSWNASAQAYIDLYHDLLVGEGL